MPMMLRLHYLISLMLRDDAAAGIVAIRELLCRFDAMLAPCHITLIAAAIAVVFPPDI